jgi:hypothetical protein
MMLRGTIEFRQPPAKRDMLVLAGVRVSITDDVGIEVVDGLTITHLLLVDTFIDRITIRTECEASITVRRDFLVGLLQILAGNESTSSLKLTDKCQNLWFISQSTEKIVHPFYILPALFVLKLKPAICWPRWVNYTYPDFIVKMNHGNIKVRYS